MPNLTEASAQKTTQLLQENHEKHHIFFNTKGFHNHIAHHLLTVFALGASPEQIQRHYDSNASYQRPPVAIHRDLIDHKLGDPQEFRKYLGDEKYYRDYLIFFRKEMERLPGGYKDVVNEYLLKGDERADDLLGRCYNGIVHPLIHLGFGIEFEQPAIIAEALAQAAIHEEWLTPFMLDMEKAAQAGKAKGQPSKTIVQICEAMQADDKLSNAPHEDDGNKLRDGIFARAYDEMVQHASQWHVKPEELEKKTAEMINFSAFMAGAAQHPPNEVKFDFFYIHSINCAIFFPAFLKQDWLTTESKIRLLEWKTRIDLADYTRCGLPKLRLSEINDYVPKHKNKSDWEQVISRVNAFDDDGHASKLIRALAKGHEFSGPFERGSDMQIVGENWKKEAAMAIDSVESGEPHWVFSTGYDSSWKNVPERSQSRL